MKRWSEIQIKKHISQMYFLGVPDNMLAFGWETIKSSASQFEDAFLVILLLDE